MCKGFNKCLVYCIALAVMGLNDESLEDKSVETSQTELSAPNKASQRNTSNYMSPMDAALK